MTFSEWIEIFIDEKGIDRERMIDIDLENSFHMIPVGSVIEQLKAESDGTQAQAKDILVKIDFRNGDVMHFFGFLAEKMAKDYEGMVE